LLQVVEADHGVDAIPVEQPIFDQRTLPEVAVDLLIVHEIEKRLEKNAIGKLARELLDRRQTLLGKYLVHKFTQFVFIHLFGGVILFYFTFILIYSF
jgi:hypothetical protein